MTEVQIHPAASVHPAAQLDAGVSIGPYCVVGEKVKIGCNSRLDSHVSITGLTEIGADCVFSPFSSIGTEPQDVGFKGEDNIVRIGDENIFREFVTIHKGTAKGGGQTVIGNKNYFMAYTHIAHDCRIGNETVLTNGATLGGHVEVEDYAILSAFCGVHQFCRIGRFAYIGGFSVITQDVPPFCRVAGMRPVLIYGSNAIGLRRRGIPNDRIRAVRDMIKILFYSNLNTSQAIDKIEKTCAPVPEKEELLRFVRSSKRGIIKKAAEKWESDSE